MQSHRQSQTAAYEGRCQFFSLPCKSSAQAQVSDADRNATHVPSTCHFFHSFPAQLKTNGLDKAELGGSNVEGIDIGGQAGEGLLGTVRAAE
jgi:hypothetical protein